MVDKISWKHGISEPTYYKWKSLFRSMTVSHPSQLRELQAENAKLKRMFDDLALLHHALIDIVDLKLCLPSAGPYVHARHHGFDLLYAPPHPANREGKM